MSPLDLEVRGPTVRVAEEGDELLYQAVIAELATQRRRLGPDEREREELVGVGQELAQPQPGGAQVGLQPRRA